MGVQAPAILVGQKVREVAAFELEEGAFVDRPERPGGGSPKRVGEVEKIRPVAGDHNVFFLPQVEVNDAAPMHGPDGFAEALEDEVRQFPRAEFAEGAAGDVLQEERASVEDRVGAGDAGNAFEVPENGELAPGQDGPQDGAGEGVAGAVVFEDGGPAFVSDEGDDGREEPAFVPQDPRGYPIRFRTSSISHRFQTTAASPAATASGVQCSLFSRAVRQLHGRSTARS